MNASHVARYTDAAIVALRTLTITNSKMTYAEFGVAIGLLNETSDWHIMNRQQISTILDLAVGLALKMCETIDHRRVVNKASGLPGAGADSHFVIGKSA